MKMIGLATAAATSFFVVAFAESAEACRVPVSPMVTYERWLEQSESVFIGRVVSVRQVRWTRADGSVRSWTMPEAEVVGGDVLQGVSPDRMTLRGDGIVTECFPTLHSEVSRLQSGDDALIMVDLFGSVQGVLPLQSEAAQIFIARLSQPDSRKQ